ncbi:MAG: hypothetical protein E7329_12525 [Clostridiales bacterium]|nr:hypothetical protein [Clostridiales bacterium]
MELMFLGTAAAEGAPAVFCDCEKCRYAREKGGKEIRTRSGAMIDGKIKLDFCPDTYMHMLKYGLDFSKLHSILIGHTHSDHFYYFDIHRTAAPDAHPDHDAQPVTVYGNERVGKLLAPWLNTNKHLKFQRMIPFETVEIEGYRVTALEAVHVVDKSGNTEYPVVFSDGKTYYRQEEALFYLIEKDGASILYAHDTDEFTPADMEFLAGKKIDIISMDCTNGYLEMDYIGHMGAKDNERMRERLLQCGAADEHTVFIANHFSHNGLLPYEDLEMLLPDFKISYDGMKISTK